MPVSALAHLILTSGYNPQQVLKVDIRHNSKLLIHPLYLADRPH